MKNTFGSSVSVTLFGESHGEAIGAVVDGLAPGIKVDEEFIAQRLDLRKPYGKISTARHEADECKIVSGVFNGYTTGTPVTLIIENKSQHSKDYSKTKDLLRPGHADFTAKMKYHGFEDYRGGGHFSGRITAPLVAAGAILTLTLNQKGIKIGTHISSCLDISDREFENYENDINYLNGEKMPVLDKEAAKKITQAAESAAENGDSVGGILQTVVTGLPAGVGEPWFDTVEGIIAHAVFSVPAVKGIEFGKGFEFSKMHGSEANDPFEMKDGKIVTSTNNNGGINGGITNSMPILFNTVIKPTPSIYKKQNTVNFHARENAELEIQGRHDPAIFHRARVVIDSVTAIALCDLLAQRFGTDWLTQQ